MSNDKLQSMLYPLADALEMDLAVESFKITGSRKGVYEVFEGYSPTVVAQVKDSLIDEMNGISAVVIQVWGNLNIMMISEDRKSLLTLFVFDRAKAPDPKYMNPWQGFWSRKDCYKWLEPSCQAIYSRSIFDTVWAKLPEGMKRLRLYNSARNQGASSGQAYKAMWDE